MSQWTAGCRQSVLQNYTLVYADGYYRSMEECQFCHDMRGPFVSKTELFKKVSNVLAFLKSWGCLYLWNHIYVFINFEKIQTVYLLSHTMSILSVKMLSRVFLIVIWFSTTGFVRQAIIMDICVLFHVAIKWNRKHDVPSEYSNFQEGTTFWGIDTK